MVTGIFGEAKLECRLSTKSSQRSRPTITRSKERERERRRDTHTHIHTHGGQGSSCIAPSGERLDSPVYVHPLGLSCGGYRPTAIERLAVSPNATLFSAAMSDPTGVCSSLTTISTLSLSLAIYLSVPLSLRSVSTYPSIYPTPPVVHTYSSMQHTCFIRAYHSSSLSLSLGYQVQVILEPRGWAV